MRTNEIIESYNHPEVQRLAAAGFGEADFDVAQTTVEYSVPDPNSYHGYKTLRSFPTKAVHYRTDTGEPVAIHGTRYNPLSFKDMIRAARVIISNLSEHVDISGVTENISVSPNSGMCAVKYRLPACRYTTPDGDTMILEILALSSHNGVWSAVFSVGGYQFHCLNGQFTVRNPAALYKAKHTASLDINHAIRLISKATSVMEEEVDLWHEWYNAPMKKLDRVDAFAAGANFKGDWTQLYEDMRDYNKLEHVNNRTFNYLNEVYNKTYFPRMGDNKWAVYNALTDWSTHAPSSSKNTIALSQRRVEKAREVVDNYLLAA